MTATPAEDTAAAEAAAEAERLATEEAAASADGGDDEAAKGDLGDAGKKALDAMKAKWRAERDRAKGLQEQLAAATKSKEGDDDKPDLDALRQQARDEARSESLRERALDKLEVKAARLFQNPDDARAFLADKVDEFLDDGKVDVEAITDALDDLLKERPYLGVTQGDTKRFKGTGDGGPKGNAGKPQLTRADLKTMTPDQILTAKAEGRMNHLIGIT